MRERIVGLLLAGGRARRMGGGDKCLVELGGRPLLEHVIGRIRPQVDGLVLNANGDPARFSAFGLPVVADPVAGFQGPLAGILAGLLWLRAHAPDVRWMVSVPTDTPFLPRDLVHRLYAAVQGEGTRLACAASGGRPHPVVGLWPADLARELERALVEEGIRKIDVFTARFALSVVDWPATPFDPFFNVNRPGDVERAEALLSTGVEAPPA